MTDAEIFVTLANVTVAPAVLSALMALVLPAVIILIRKNLRKERVEIIKEIEKAFDFDNGIPSFELVKSKYSNTPVPPGGALYLSAIPYIAVSAFGLLTIFTPIANILSAKPDTFPAHLAVILFAGFEPEIRIPLQPTASPAPVVAASQAGVTAPDATASPAAGPPDASPDPTPGEAGEAESRRQAAAASEAGTTLCAAPSCKEIGRAATVLAFTFAGAIVFSLSYLIRAVGNFELTPSPFSESPCTCCSRSPSRWRSGACSRASPEAPRSTASTTASPS